MTPRPLIMLHHAGGSAAVFDRLAEALPDGVQPLPLELPGRGRRWREAPVTTVEDAVDDLLRAVAGQRGEIAIFGHSVGAYLGLCLAARLAETGGPRCPTVFVSANAGPVSAELPCEGSPLLTTDEEIFAIAEKSGGTISPQIREHPVLRERTAALLRADFSLGDSFLRKRRATTVSADLVVCCGTEDVFTDAQLDSWRHSSTGRTSITPRLPGGHFYLEQPAEAAALAETIARTLLGPSGRTP
ncbi:thioesterase II family protein [Streptomyces sp. NPDC021212]|uniref:thioesterase II family protein n=1 Tax=Streptomyces sp. NPDC021212 TaxID=3365118 RepID=UPI00378C99F6